MNSILVADDDRDIVKLIAEMLADEGYEVIRAYDGEEVLKHLESALRTPDLLILDIMMPKLDGLEVLRRIRSMVASPILLLSARGRELDRVIGLEVGADDYMTKPFSTHELVARVRAHLRRQGRQLQVGQGEAVLSESINIGNLRLDKLCYEAYCGGQKLDLSTREFQILLLLAERRNQVLSREQIYESIWGSLFSGDIQTVTVHITNLRKKLAGCQYTVKTVWGIGYKLAEAQE